VAYSLLTFTVMPVATFSRRKSTARRQASSDIEEDRPTQQRAGEQVDDEDSEDEKPRVHRRPNGVKKEKKGNSLRQVEKTREDGDEHSNGEDDDDRIDVENFQNHPLRRDDLQKLQGLSKDWQQMEESVRKNWGIIGDVATAIAEAAEGDDVENGLAEADDIMKNLIDVGVEMQAHGSSINEIYQKVGQGENIGDVLDRYNNGVIARMEEYAKKTTRQRYAKSEVYNLFKQGIFEVQHPDKPMPPLTELIPHEDGDDSDDDDLEMGGVTQIYTCPITLTPLVNPMTSQVCGHSFSEEAIRQTFRGSASAVKRCPASGCNKSLKLSDLTPNKELAKKVKSWERRNKRAAENSDAEEVIE